MLVKFSGESWSHPLPEGFYVYIIYRPDGRPCYVGKGKGNRYRDHFVNNEKGSWNPNLARIIKNANRKLCVEIVQDSMSEKHAFSLEESLIREIGRKQNGGPLVNLTDGGEGECGRVVSEEVRESIRKRMLGNTFTRGKKHTPEHIEKAAAKKRGKHPSEETRKKMSEAQKRRAARGDHPALGYKWTPEQRAKIKGHKGPVHTEEHKQKMSKRMTGRFVSEETKNKNRLAAIKRDVRPGSLTGIKGVTIDRSVWRSKPYKATVMIDGKRKQLGYFATAEEAHVARQKAAPEIYGEFI